MLVDITGRDSDGARKKLLGGARAIKVDSEHCPQIFTDNAYPIAL